MNFSRLLAHCKYASEEIITHQTDMLLKGNPSRTIRMPGRTMVLILTSGGEMYQSIRPCQKWLDTQGKRIQAHGGSIFFVDGFYYWYGENKKKTLPGSDIWHYGVRMYRSADLYNWEDLGVVMQPELNDPDHPLHPAQYMDRPHILYCDKTRKYVLWMKIMGKDGIQYQTVALADQITGPFKYHKKFRPLGMNCGDFDLVVDPMEKKAYYYFERVRSELISADLTDDYTDVTGYYSTHFPRVSPPDVRDRSPSGKIPDISKSP